MSTRFFNCRPMPLAHTFCRCARLGVIAFAVAVFAPSVQAQDYVSGLRETATTWGMFKIAVIQAASGDVQGAKHTLTQIGEWGERPPADVTVVSFCCGRAIHESRPAEPCERGEERFVEFSAAAPGESPEGVPAEVPAGLPSDYLAVNARHGALVAFTDEYDAAGTRITSRRYADGYVMIETPR
jgi:hypothetical protein